MLALLFFPERAMTRGLALLFFPERAMTRALALLFFPERAMTRTLALFGFTANERMSYRRAVKVTSQGSREEA